MKLWLARIVVVTLPLMAGACKIGQPPTDEGAGAGMVTVVTPPQGGEEASNPDTSPAPMAGEVTAGEELPPPPPVKEALPSVAECRTMNLEEAFCALLEGMEDALDLGFDLRQDIINAWQVEGGALVPSTDPWDHLHIHTSLQGRESDPDAAIQAVVQEMQQAALGLWAWHYLMGGASLYAGGSATTLHSTTLFYEGGAPRDGMQDFCFAEGVVDAPLNTIEEQLPGLADLAANGSLPFELRYTAMRLAANFQLGVWYSRTDPQCAGIRLVWAEDVRLQSNIDVVLGQAGAHPELDSARGAMAEAIEQLRTVVASQ